MFSCKDVTEHASRHLDGECGVLQRLKIRLHLLICVHCRRYLAQLRVTAGLMRQLTRESPATDAIDGIIAALDRARH
jgi:predicted anti-sigma-YlaC factor YlaD